MNSYYGSVNGPACHYARLARYNNCSLAEVAATLQTSDKDFKFQGNIPTSAAKVEAGVEAGMVRPTRPPAAPPALPPAAPAASVAQPTAAPVTEGFTEPDYTPTYKVPNYPPINTDALTHGVAYNCGGYFNILDAYGSSAGNCVTNYVNN